MKRITLLFVLMLFVSIQVLFAQRKITGTVTGKSDGGPLPGVTVVVKNNTSTGAITDFDGKYSIKVPDGEVTLVFSFVGMQTKEVVTSKSTNIDVVLESSDVALDDVVVTALGISREKKSLGYASQGVSSDDLSAANDVNPVASLSGKVAGLQVAGQGFGGSQNILIRGASSFSGNNQPLFVVDGIPISNDGFNSASTQQGGGGYDYGSMISDLNPNDIQNIEVLKGSAASALYGSRGQNGVIMITTKSGKKGSKSFSVDLNTGVTFENVSLFPNVQNSYGGGAGDFKTVKIDGKDYSIVGYGVDETWGPKFKGQQVLQWWNLSDWEQTDKSAAPQTSEWQASPNDIDAFYETGVAYQNSINVVSTSEKSAVRFGYSNVNMTGTMPNSSQIKNSFNINGQSTIFDGFVDVKANLSYVDTYSKGRQATGYANNNVAQKFYQWGQRQLDMSKLENYKNPDGTQRVWNRKSWSNPRPAYADNPYWSAYENFQDDDRTRLFGTTGAKINFTDYLSAEGNVYLDNYTFNVRERVAVGSQAQSRYRKITRQATETNVEGKLNFRKNYDLIDVSAMLGGNIRKNDYSRNYASTSGGLVVPGLYNLNNSVDKPTLTDYVEEKLVKSMFGMVSFGWNNLAYIDATYRKDHDSSLPDGNNSYSYSSISGSFILSELIEMPWLNNLKLRANYGETGNGTSPYNVFNVWKFGTPFNGNPQFSNDESLKNNNLKPERTKEIELGFESVFFNSRLGIDFSWYSRNTLDQIVAQEISGSSGYVEQFINAGKINNKGVELMIYGTPVKISDFSWEVNFNFARNKNKVLDLPEGLDKIQLARAPFGGAYLNATEGATFQELYAYNYVYDKEGNKVIDENTGFYAKGELKSVGSVLPDFTAGIKNKLTYKSFDFSFLIDMSKGGNYYSLTNMWGYYSGMLDGTETSTSEGNTIREDGLVLNGVIATSFDEDNNPLTFRENDVNISGKKFSKLHYHGNGTPSVTSVFDASYFKLREVSLGYTLPKLVKAIRSIRVNVYGKNLLVWGLDANAPGIDPETIVNGNGNIQGLEGGITPATRQYGFNIQVKF